MRTDVVVLVNPTSGRGRGMRVATEVAGRLRDAGVPARLVHGRDAADAVDVARKVVDERPDALVAVGGDGLVHLAVQALAGTDVPLGVIPAGTGDDIARALGIPLDTAAATATVLAGTARTIDLGRVRDEWFAGVLYAGFDSAVNERVNTMTWPHGRLRYDLAILLELRSFEPLRFIVEMDGEESQLEAMFVSVGNTRQYGGGLRICPDAEPDDGLFDVTIIAPVPRRVVPVLLPKLYKGTHVTHPAVRMFRARTVGLAASGVVAYADGERIGPLPLHAEIVPGALRVITP
jgi:diacylglycerol kinase (ATP)